MKTTNQQPATVRTSPRWKQPLISTGCVLFASLLMSVNIKSFVRAGNLIPGGFTGLSLREKVYLIYGTDDRTELFSGRSDPGNADYI